MLLALTLVSGTGTAFAQQLITELPFSTQSRTETMFNSAKVGTLKKRFDFLLPAGNKMILEFTTDNQVDSLPNIDDLLQEVWKDLAALGDSLQTPLSNKRVDVVFSPVDKKVRVRDYPQQGDVFRIKDGDVTQLKVEQDTLRIILFTRRASALSGFPGGQPYYITFLVNHLNDIPALQKQTNIATTVALFKKDFAARRFKGSSASFTQYYAAYDATKGVRLIPTKGALNSYGRKITFIPYVQTGIQYLRGAWVPSAGAGIELTIKPGENLENKFQLLWEPYFFFDKDSLKKPSLQRNDFITFKYLSYSKYNSGARVIEFRQTFSLGYLIRRSGNYFEPTTFKFSLPGLQTKNILLEPEFVFNDFFKNFSPSLKLTLFLE